MPSRRKRKRHKKWKCSLDSPTVPNPVQTIRRILPRPHKIFGLSDFLHKYTPSLATHESIEGCDKWKSLEGMVIAPLDSIQIAHHLKTPERREPIPGIVDDAVWALVQRRDRLRRMGKDGRNVLAQGYFSPSSDEQLDGPAFCHSMRAGLMHWSANEHVSFCKTSRLFQLLHLYAGDEVLRMILLHTRFFVSVEDEIQQPRGNFVLLCGPPLVGAVSLPQVQAASSGKGDLIATENTHAKPKKKRRRSHLPVDTWLQGNSVISRFSLFYSDAFTPKIGFHHNHLFYDPSMTPEKLLAFMADYHTLNGQSKSRKGWKRLRVSGIGICQSILDSVRKCDFHRLLHHYCPLPESLKKRDQSTNSLRNESDNISLQGLVQAFTPGQGIVSFLASILRRVFPAEFWGSPHNLDCVIGSVQAFINLRRKECLSNKRLMHGIRTTDLKWLHGDKRKKSKLSRTDHEATTCLSLKIMRWLFRGLIIPLLRSIFYVTETEFGARRVYYYRKPVWSLFRSLSMRKLLQRQFRELSHEEARKRLEVQKMGFSHLRLVPKTTGVRPIAHLSQRVPFLDTPVSPAAPKRKLTVTLDIRKEEDPSSKRLRYDSVTVQKKSRRSNHPRGTGQRSTNAVLSQVFDVLTYEASRHENSFGCGLQGLADFYPRYQRHIVNLRQHLGPRENLNLIFASVDIEKCYDNINQKYMYSISRRQLSRHDYVIQQFNLLYGNRMTGNLERKSKKVVGPPEGHNLLHQGHSEISHQCKNVVFDSRKCQLAQRSQLSEILEEHLRNHLVLTTGRFGTRYLLQSGGISQGSVLSMVLCNLYYGEMEGLLLHRENPKSPKVMDPLSTEEERDFLARLVDDFLFVSTYKPAVANFLTRMYQGNEALGVQINREKSLVSESMELDTSNEGDGFDVPTAPVRPLFDRPPFPWCGMLFDTMTGEVYMDYERFHNGKICDSLTVDTNGNEGRKFAMRVESFVRPRCIPILFDGSINSKDTVVVNFYQMMMFAAAKTAEHLRCADLLLYDTSNQDFLIRCLDSLPDYAGRQIRCNLQNQSPRRIKFRLDEEALSLLSWHAFGAVFRCLTDFGTLNIRIDAEFEKRQSDRFLAFGKSVARAYNSFQLEKLIDLS